MKKITFILIFLGLLPLGCFCPESDLEYIQINSFDTALFIDMREVTAPLEIPPGTEFKIRLDFHDIDYTTSSRGSSTIFTFSTFATSCQNKGGLGLSSKIDSLGIFSSERFINASKGTNLSDYFIGQYQYYDAQERQKIEGEVDLLTSYLNTSAYTVNHGFLKLAAIPNDSTTHIFTVKVFLEDGRVLEQETGSIKFLP